MWSDDGREASGRTRDIFPGHPIKPAFCDIMIRPGGLVSGRMPERRNLIYMLLAKNLKLAVFVLKTMECFSKPTIAIRSEDDRQP